MNVSVQNLLHKRNKALEQLIHCNKQQHVANLIWQTWKRIQNIWRLIRKLICNFVMKCLTTATALLVSCKAMMFRYFVCMSIKIESNQQAQNAPLTIHPYHSFNYVLQCNKQPRQINDELKLTIKLCNFMEWEVVDSP